jgi:hypothetical protein
MTAGKTSSGIFETMTLCFNLDDSNVDGGYFFWVLELDYDRQNSIIITVSVMSKRQYYYSYMH